jgi:flavin reductase (DIM6/NTAB) family NADH-FMN oxidoreductase RutF
MKKSKKEIGTEEFSTKVFDLWDNQWLLLTSGDFQSESFNSMTVAWGGFGIMWNLPIAMVVVRPSRFTYEFINDHDAFTLCGFPDSYRKALSLLGTKSGRDGDKIAESGLTPIASKAVAAPIFEEASLAVACRKIYYSDFDPTHFLDDRIEKQYNGRDYHRMVYGEILQITAHSDTDI